nr:muconolactone Delta-isomerase family protein [Rhodococcus sp. (in: high G+C Gram-positive bacteria)]
MPDYFVRIDSSALHALPAEQKRELLEREWVRGRELHAKGILRRLWQLPAQKGNIGLWSAADAEELNDAVQSLPIWPYITTHVEPVALHPLFAAIDADPAPE